MPKVFNKSTLFVEPAKDSQCPRCKGAGRVFSDKDESCHLCHGHGRLWLSTTGSGWTRAKFKKIEDSQLY